MLSPQEEKKIRKFLALSPNPEDTFSYEELLGFLFGLAMTPEPILADEWIPCIFGGEMPACAPAGQERDLSDCLVRIAARFAAAHHDDSLDFPLDIAELKDDQIGTVYEWVSGLDEALTLREALWDPESFPKLDKVKKEELYFSLLIIQGLVDPEELADFFENLPDEFLRESFPGMDGGTTDREMQIQLFLLASLPLAIRTLQQHSRLVKKRQAGKKPVQLSLVRSKTKNPQPSCRCDHAGQAGSCCDGGRGGTVTPIPARPKKANVIKVDFPQHREKAEQSASGFQLKVELDGARPPIWRRILVPGYLTLVQLHKVIQLCMGWTDSHLHEFLIDHTCYSLPEEHNPGRTGKPKNEAKATLQALSREICRGFFYIYDFSAEWTHRITVEKVVEPGTAKPYPVLIAGKRACPPEEVGGMPGYLRLLKILQEPGSDLYLECKDWLDSDFVPERFGIEEISLINAVLEEVYAQDCR